MTKMDVCLLGDLPSQVTCYSHLNLFLHGENSEWQSNSKPFENLKILMAQKTEQLPEV